MALGDAFRPPAPPAPVEASASERLMAAISERLSEVAAGLAALSQMAPPTVHVEQPDLSEIVSAVVGIKGPASATEIADAIAERLRFPEPADPSAALAAIAAAMEKLEFRMKGIGTQAYGGGAVKLEPGQVVTAVGGSSEATLAEVRDHVLNVRRGLTDFESRLDYQARTDGNPEYVGKAAQGTATSGTWTIQRLTYDASARLTRAQVLTGAWDNRTTLGWP